MRRQPSIAQYALDDVNNNSGKESASAGDVVSNRVRGLKKGGGGTTGGKDNVAFSPSIGNPDEFNMTERGQFQLDEDGPGKKMTLRKPLEVSIHDTI